MSHQAEIKMLAHLYDFWSLQGRTHFLGLPSLQRQPAFLGFATPSLSSKPTVVYGIFLLSPLLCLPFETALATTVGPLRLARINSPSQGPVLTDICEVTLAMEQNRTCAHLGIRRWLFWRDPLFCLLHAVPVEGCELQHFHCNRREN